MIPPAYSPIGVCVSLGSCYSHLSQHDGHVRQTIMENSLLRLTTLRVFVPIRRRILLLCV